MEKQDKKHTKSAIPQLTPKMKKQTLSDHPHLMIHLPQYDPLQEAFGIAGHPLRHVVGAKSIASPTTANITEGGHWPSADCASSFSPEALPAVQFTLDPQTLFAFLAQFSF